MRFECNMFSIHGNYFSLYSQFQWNFWQYPKERKIKKNLFLVTIFGSLRRHGSLIRRRSPESRNQIFG